jgi:hypothetical protein
MQGSLKPLPQRLLPRLLKARPQLPTRPVCPRPKLQPRQPRVARFGSIRRLVNRSRTGCGLAGFRDVPPFEPNILGFHGSLPACLHLIIEALRHRENRHGSSSRNGGGNASDHTRRLDPFRFHKPLSGFVGCNGSTASRRQCESISSASTGSIDENGKVILWGESSPHGETADALITDLEQMLADAKRSRDDVFDVPPD